MASDTTPITADDVYYSSVLSNVKNSYNGSVLDKIPIAARFINLGVKDKFNPNLEEAEEKNDE